jgi:ankyrin repeat protein
MERWKPVSGVRSFALPVVDAGGKSFRAGRRDSQGCLQRRFQQGCGVVEGPPELVDKKDKLGQTPLIVAVNHNKLEIAELLLANGANVNARDSHMHTPLMVALGIYNHDKMVRLLLAKGADVNLADDSGMTPIAYSVRQGQMEDVKVLLANDANVNVVTGSSPLNLAILAHRIETVELLLANGADVNYKSRDLTPLRYAKLADETRIEALLKKYGGHE